MSLLLYGIFRNKKGKQPGLPAGVEGERVFVLYRNGLAAAASRVSSSDLSIRVDDVIAYGNVIDALYRSRTVIPVQYGSLLGEESDITRLLEKCGRQYESLLNEIEDCAEMGIRVLLPKRDVRGFGNGETTARSSASPGREYLFNRREHYVREGLMDGGHHVPVKRYQDAFAGLFRKCRHEIMPVSRELSGDERQLLSLQFLIKRENIGAFQSAFQHLQRLEAVKMLMSGPWPPYSFVTTESGRVRDILERGWGQRLSSLKLFR